MFLKVYMYSSLLCTKLVYVYPRKTSAQMKSLGYTELYYTQQFLHGGVKTRRCGSTFGLEIVLNRWSRAQNSTLLPLPLLRTD
jgi:hypothetical protein